MFIDVFGTYGNVKSDSIKDKDVVVIDVYRATTVIVTALANGAECVTPVGSIEEAWELFNRDRERTVLGGEREGAPIDGFHLDNSPISYTSESVGEKKVVLTTSNGTNAIKVCKNSSNLYIASFLNVSGVVKKLLEYENDISVVCAGTFGRFALEDGFCAGMIVSSLSKKRDVSVSDLGMAAKLLFEKENDILSALKNGSVAYHYLERLEYKADIEFCLQRNVYDIVPMYDAGLIRV